MEDVCWNIEDCFITFEEMDVLDPIFMEVLGKVAILSLSSTVKLPNQAATLYLMGFSSTAVLNNGILFSVTPVWASWESEFSKTPHDRTI